MELKAEPVFKDLVKKDFKVAQIDWEKKPTLEERLKTLKPVIPVKSHKKAALKNH